MKIKEKICLAGNWVQLGPNLSEAGDGSLKNAAILSILREKCSEASWFNNCNIGRIHEALIDTNEYLNGLGKNLCACEHRPLSARQVLCAESTMAFIHDEEYSKALHELADCVDDYGTATTRAISINEYALYNCLISCFIKKMEPEAEVIHMCEWKPVEDFKTSPFVTSCGVTHWRQDEVSDFTFCPYCGKRLKEVRKNE